MNRATQSSATVVSTRPLRVVHVLSERGGGGEQVVSEVEGYLTSQGHETARAIAPRAGARESVRERDLRGFDVIHCHGLRAVRSVPRHARRRVLFTPHGLHLYYRAGVERPAVAMFIRHLLRDVPLSACIARHEAASLIRLGVPPADIRLVLNGVRACRRPTDAERQAARGRLGFDAADRVVAFVGGLRSQKDPLLAVRSFRALQRYEPRAFLAMAGDGPLRPCVEKELPNQARMLGQIPEASDLLVAADVVLNTSRWEGLSLALLEAMWRCRPIVATAAPGNREAVGRGGLIAHSRRPEEIGALMAALLRDEPRRALIGARGRERAERLFSSERMGAGMLSLYSSYPGVID